MVERAEPVAGSPTDTVRVKKGGYEKVIPLARRSLQVKGDRKVDIGVENRQREKWIAVFGVCGFLLATVTSLVTTGVYFFIKSRLAPRLDLTDPVYLTMGSVCRATHKGEMAGCIFELEQRTGQCSGPVCKGIVWTLTVDIETGVAAFRRDEFDVTVSNTTTAHCGKSKWCRQRKCVSNGNLNSRWKREIKFDVSEWIEDNHSPCFTDDRTAESKRAWRLFRKYESCPETCSYNGTINFRVAFRRCDNNDTDQAGAEEERRPKPCSGLPLQVYMCGECINAINVPKPCEPDRVELLNGDCLIRCNTTGRYHLAPPGALCKIKGNSTSRGVCLVGTCYEFVNPIVYNKDW